MRLALAVAVAGISLVAAGCDDSESRPTQSVAVYFLRDGKVSPVRRTVETGSTGARTALTSLLAGPSEDDTDDGLTTAIPHGTTVGGLELTDGVATVDVRGPLPTTQEQRLHQIGQIVATLTRVPTVRAVRFRNGRTWTRRAIEAQLPQILIESPLPGDRVTTPIHVRGTANVFEATVSFEVRDDGGKVVERSFTTATSGTGARGTFETDLAVPNLDGPATIVAFEASAEDGRPLHMVEVPIAVKH